MNKGVPPENWDERLQALGGSVIQSRAWAELQQELGRTVVWDEGQWGSWLGVIMTAPGLKYLYLPYGPAPVKGEDKGAFNSMVAAGKVLGADFIRFEPAGAAVVVPDRLRNLGGRQIAEMQPAHTQILDLTRSEEQLRRDLNSGHRNLINGTERRGVKVRQSQAEADFREFLGMLDDTAKRSRIVFLPHSYYQALWKVLRPRGILKLYMAEANGHPVAGALFYDWGGTRAYAHAGAYQDLNRQSSASVSLLWQAIIDAKNAGLKKFDLWGVAPTEDPAHPWAGITRFKKGFGGQQVDYAGTWDLPLHKFKYSLYSVYRRFRGRR